MPALLFALLALLLFSGTSAAEESVPFESNEPAAVDKSVYNLFNPVPPEHMREFNTDRPDKTESPYTVDAGHMQLEMDLVSYTHDHDTSHMNNITTDDFAIAPANLKIGVLNNVDLQAIIETYNHVRTDNKVWHSIDNRSGFGDVTLRAKVNLWGNDGGSTAFALMPFIKIPTNQDHLGNHYLESGLILPMTVELPLNWELEMMTELDTLHTSTMHASMDNGYYLLSVNSASLDHRIAGPLEGYFELYSEASGQQDAQWLATADVGLLYKLSENWQLDAGVNFGLTSSADDINVFTGLSVRM